MVAMERQEIAPTPLTPTGHRGAYPDFARMLGDAAWRRLPASVRARFPSDHSDDEVIHYFGRMKRVEASKLGRLFAYALRIFDTPVAPFVGNGIDTVVKVYPDTETGGVVWERIYDFPGRPPVVIKSTKRLDVDGGLIESLSRGLRMRLKVFEQDGTLRFSSTGYYIELFGIRFSLPQWFPPGTTHIIHRDEGFGHFTFTMFTEHRWFGAMFFQEGVFEQMGVK